MRLVQYMHLGLLQFTFGSRDSLVDWLHCDNLCQAQVRGQGQRAGCGRGGEGMEGGGVQHGKEGGGGHGCLWSIGSREAGCFIPSDLLWPLLLPAAWLQVLAAAALTPATRYVAAGQAYMISDGHPINNFEFLRPLIEGLGFRCGARSCCCRCC